MASVRDGSVIAGKRSRSFELVKEELTVLNPITTKFDPVILMAFLLAPKSIVAPIRSLVALESAIVARVFAPVLTTPAPAPDKTLSRPVVVKLAVHLPEHLRAPMPYASEADDHLPVREDFVAGVTECVRDKSPVIPLPIQSNT